MAITRNFNLFLNAGHSVPLVINANQYDQGESWVFTLYNADGTKYTPSTGAIVGIKSDGLGIINSGSVVDGNVVINETQQMTAAVGKAVFELMIDSQTHGTANFVVLVEEKPGNNADLSESDLSLLQEAIDATSPLPTGGTVGQVLTKTANGSAWSDAGTPTQEQVADAVSDWADENITVSTGVVIDTSLSVAGAAADAKKTGDEITDLKSQISSLEAIPRSVKLAMDTLFRNVAMKDNAVYSDEYATIHAWASAINLVSISASFNPSRNYYNTDSLDDLKGDLTVTGTFDNDTTATVTGYTLTGNLVEGTNTITVTYEGKTATFDVTAKNGFYYTANKGLLSNQSYITATGSAEIAETLVDNYLRLYSAKLSSGSPRIDYEFTPSTLTSEAHLKAVFKVADIGYVATNNTTSAGYFSFRLSDGTDGASYGVARYGGASATVKSRIQSSSSLSWSNDATANQEHTVQMDIVNGKQTIILDGSTIVENADVQSLWMNTCRLTVYQNTTKPSDVYIKSIEFECN